MTWQGIRIDHHESDHSALLLEAVRPVVAALRDDPQVADVSVRTHWANGPHVLIAIATDPDHFERDLLPRTRAAVLAWLTVNPSRTVLDDADYMGLSAEWARSEGFPLADPALMPNNCVTVAACDRAVPMGLPALGDVRDRFQASALDTVWYLLAMRQANKAAFLAECACMIAAVGVVADDDRFDFWPTSMRAHADGYFAADPAARDRFEMLHQRIGPGLARRMASRGLMGAVPPPDATIPPQFVDWIDRLRATLADLDRIVATSHRHLAQHDVYAGTGHDFAGATPPWPLRIWMTLMQLTLIGIVLKWVFGRLPGTSWALRRAAIMKTQTHLQYRILINLIYGLLPLLGIGPTERGSLCYLIWRSCETSFPQTIDRARHSVEQLGGRAMLERVA